MVLDKENLNHIKQMLWDYKKRLNEQCLEIRGNGLCTGSCKREEYILINYQHEWSSCSLFDEAHFLNDEIGLWKGLYG